MAQRARRKGFPGKVQPVIRQNQHMAVVLMFEVIVDAFFFAEPLQERQVGLIKLNAERSHRIASVGQFKTEAVFGDRVFAEQLTQDGGRVELMKNPAAAGPARCTPTPQQR